MQIIKANQNNEEYFKELFRYRELFYFFAWRDILVRYKQAFFGVSWALIRPLLTMALFTLIFGTLAHFPSGNVPYPLFALAGLLPWQLFASTLLESSVCLLNNPQLLSKVYFPRLIIPASQLLVQGVDFGINLVLLLILMVCFGEVHAEIIYLPLFILLVAILCLAISFFLSAVTVKYRDVRFIVQFAVQFGIYISPVGYGSFIIPEKYQWLYFLNPLAGIIEGFRWSLFGIEPPMQAWISSVLISFLLLVVGYLYFRRVEKQFGDII